MILHYKAGDKDDHKRLGQKLSELNPGEYVIEVTKNRPIRSIGANRYYWGIVLKTISIAVGYDTEELHEMFKLKFNAKTIQFPDGTTELTLMTTSDLDTEEFRVYISKVKQWAIKTLTTNPLKPFTFPEQADVDYLRWSAIKEDYDKVFNQF